MYILIWGHYTSHGLLLCKKIVVAFFFLLKLEVNCFSFSQDLECLHFKSNRKLYVLHFLLSKPQLTF